ncbi:hypothetical protein KIN20_024784 [Parelaphostrongylus tenuis]|uniref:Uncharacterized protein n=1 Tax=Parelaphostrongylus tenuis TaxID=148309 RepID=A0AAD5NBF0_PARTN|nr:hypothetical protein KIN20_024784 [Parelaphostrongylus tenuis]
MFGLIQNRMKMISAASMRPFTCWQFMNGHKRRLYSSAVASGWPYQHWRHDIARE